MDGYHRIGTIELPLSTDTGNSLLKDGDPASYYMLEYFAFAITHNLEARWLKECQALGRADLNKIVKQKFPYSIEPYFNTDSLKEFPLLTLYRTQGRYEDKTKTWLHSKTTFQLDFILPPLRMNEAERLLPFLDLTHKSIVSALEDHRHPQFLNNIDVWEASGIEEINPLGFKLDNLFTDKNLAFPTMSLQIEVAEIQRTPEQGSEPFGSFYINADLEDSTEDYQDVVVDKYEE